MGFGDFFQHLFLVFASCLGLIGIPLPVPLPPLPEDPALLRVAPADSVLFVQWFGSAEPAEAPANRSERLAAEPEVRALVAKLVTATRGMLELEGQRREETPAVLALFDMLVTALQRPGCVFVRDMTPLSAGIVIHSGDDAATVAKAFGEALAKLAPAEIERATKDIGGVAWQVLPLPGELQFFGWAAIDGYVAFTVGERTAAQIVAGLRGQDAGLGGNAALQKLRPGCKVERPVLRTYASVAKLSEQIPFTKRFWQPLGVSQATAALAESGLDGADFVSRLQLVLPKPEGLLGALRGKPLSQDDLALIPDDAHIAMALRGGDGSFEKLLLDLMAAFAGQDMKADWQEFQVQVERQAEVQVLDDLIAHAEDCAVAWSSPSQGGIGFTGAVAAIPLRDGETFATNLKRMWDVTVDRAPSKAKDRAAGRRISHRGYLEQFTDGDNRVWWVDLIDRDMPFGLSWTSTEQHFLFGLMPQPLRCAISASRLPNFDRALVRQRLVARRGEAVAMFYLDLKGTLSQAYAPGLLLFQVSSYEWQREGFDFDLADVPRLQALLPHVGPELMVLESTPGGCLITRRGSVPVLDLVLVSCGMACLMAID